MPCYSLVKVPLAVEATAIEVFETLNRMGISNEVFSSTDVRSRDRNIIMRQENNMWTVTGKLDDAVFRRELQAVKTLSVARREGYRVIREDRQAGGRIVIRLAK